MNLIEGILQEIDRNNELINFYKEIGAPGIFAKTMLEHDVKLAKEAIGGNAEIIKLLALYKKLQGNQ